VIRVLVADDESLIRAGVVAILASAGDVSVVAEAADGRAAVDAALARRPDVALVDIRMPGLDGLAAVDEMRRHLPDLRAVMLTSFGDPPNVAHALRSGAAGFVLKNCAPDELLRAVRAAHAGDAYLSPAVTRLVLGMVTPADPGRAALLARLTDRETDVLRRVAEGLSNAEIARALRMSETTIKTYVSRVLTKLDCANRVQAALLARDFLQPDR